MDLRIFCWNYCFIYNRFINMMTSYNLYYGTVDGPLKLKYRSTQEFKSEQEVKKNLWNLACSLYYKNEGKHHLPSYKDITEESKITGIPVEKLYNEHIKDLIKFYYVPTELDTVSTKDLIE